jgi:hypothetical protein
MFSRLKAFIRSIVAPRALPSSSEQDVVESAFNHELISEWSNDSQTLEQLQENGMPIPKSLRLDEIFRRLENAPPAYSRVSAHKLVRDTLNEVEDELTGLPMHHQNRMSFFSLEFDWWEDLNKNPCSTGGRYFGGNFLLSRL